MAAFEDDGGKAEEANDDEDPDETDVRDDMMNGEEDDPCIDPNDIGGTAQRGLLASGITFHCGR